MELRRYLAIASQYRWTLILTPLVAALVALGATYVVSPRFVGTAVVQLIPEQVEPSTVSLRDQAGGSTVAIGLKDPTELLAQGVVESLESQEVARQVAADLALAGRPAPQGWDAFKSQARQLLDDAWALLRFGYVARKPADEALTDRVSESMSAELVRGSYYVRISGVWRDPQTAADMANAAVRGVTEHARQIARASAAEQVQFLEQQRAAARADVDAARAAMLQYSSSSDTVAGTSLRLAVSALEVARSALRQHDLELADAQQRLTTAQQQLAALDPSTVTETDVSGSAGGGQSSTTRIVNPNLAYQTLQQRVADLAQEVAGLETRVSQGDNEITAQLQLDLADARQRLATAEQQLAAGGLEDPVRDQLTAQVLALRQQVEALTAQESAARANQRAQNEADLAEARRRLAEAQAQLAGTSPSVESVQTTTSPSQQQQGSQRISSPNPVYQTIQRDALTLEQTVASLQQRRAALASEVQAREAELRALTAADGRLEALSQELALASETYGKRTAEWYAASMEEARPVAPVRLIDPAAAPSYPAYPIKIYWALIGAAAGLAAALVLVFARNSADLSVRSAEEAEEALVMPLLAVVPSPAPRKRGRP